MQKAEQILQAVQKMGEKRIPLMPENRYPNHALKFWRAG